MEESLLEEIQDLKTEIEELNKKIEELEEELDDVKKEASDSDAENDALSSEIEELETVIGRQKFFTNSIYDDMMVDLLIENWGKLEYFALEKFLKNTEIKIDNQLIEVEAQKYAFKISKNTTYQEYLKNAFIAGVNYSNKTI